MLSHISCLLSLLVPLRTHSREPLLLSPIFGDLAQGSPTESPFYLPFPPPQHALAGGTPSLCIHLSQHLGLGPTLFCLAVFLLDSPLEVGTASYPSFLFLVPGTEDIQNIVERMDEHMTERASDLVWGNPAQGPWQSLRGRAFCRCGPASGLQGRAFVSVVWGISW